MKVEEARLVAHVCADGYLTIYVEKNSLQIVNGRRYHRPRTRYIIGYSNTEKKLLTEFADDMTYVFGIMPRRNRPDEIRGRSKRVFDRLRKLCAGNSYEWRIGKEVFMANKKVKANWLRAFFDDEATVDMKTKRIRVKSVNHMGIKQVKKLLESLNIRTRITGINIDRTWYLTITKSDIENFAKFIGFNHPKKSLRLNRLLKSMNSLTLFF